VAAFEVLRLTVRLLPAAWRRGVGSAIGTVVWLCAPSLRRRASRNIRLAFGETMTEREVGSLARRSMGHFARLAVETLVLGDDRPVPEVEGLEHVRETLARGNGIVGVSAHFGHWEFLRWAVARAGYPSVPIARPLENPWLQRRLFQWRAGLGGEMLPSRGAIAPAIRHLRRGGVVVLLGDQRRPGRGLPVRLFDTTAWVAESPAVLAARTGAAIIVAFGYLAADGQWKARIEAPLSWCRSGDPAGDAHALAAEYARILEGWIRTHPEQWLWTHARLQ
jgi:KDO2-lipid IV(A) lauroyltransferase